jgi:hypothetical protein
VFAGINHPLLREVSEIAPPSQSCGAAAVAGVAESGSGPDGWSDADFWLSASPVLATGVRGATGK